MYTRIYNPKLAYHEIINFSLTLSIPVIKCPPDYIKPAKNNYKEINGKSIAIKSKKTLAIAILNLNFSAKNFGPNLGSILN